MNTDHRAAVRDFDRFPFATAASAMRGPYRENFLRLAGRNRPDLFDRARAALEFHLFRQAGAIQ